MITSPWNQNCGHNETNERIKQIQIQTAQLCSTVPKHTESSIQKGFGCYHGNHGDDDYDNERSKN